MRPFAPVALLASCALPFIAQTPSPAKRPMTFADLAAIKRVSDPQISPSGKWVLFSVTDVSLEKNTKANSLWIVPLDGATPERRLPGAAGKFNGRFSPDGKSILFTHMGQIWIAPFDDGTGTLGDDRAVTSIETGADGAIWAPDSEHILFTSSVYPGCESHAASGVQRNTEEANCNALKDSVAASDPVKAQIFDHLLYRHWDGFVGPKHSHIFYGSIAPGADGKPVAPTDLTPASVVGDQEAPTFSLGGPLGYAISPDGKEVAYEVKLDKVPAESTNNDIFVLQLGADPKTARKVSTSPGSDDGPQYSPDGKYLAWRSQARAGFESDKYRLMVMNRKTGAIRNLMPGEFASADEFTWAPNSKMLAFTTGSDTAENVYVKYLADTQPAWNDLMMTLIGETNEVHFAPDGLHLVGTYMRMKQPAEVISNPVKLNGFPTFNVGGDMTRITHLNDALVAQLDMNEPQTFRFSTRGGYPMAFGEWADGMVLPPPNFDPAKKYPVKFLIHGGPQGQWGESWSYRWNPELLAADGYVVVMVNPRGSTGYGQQFVDEVSGDWGGRAYQDLMRGLAYAEQHYPFIDKTRECALGASYGGYMANWVLTHTDRFKCIVTHDGMYNPQSAFGTTDELWFNEWEFRPMAGPRDDAHVVVEQTKPAHPWDFYDKPASEDPFRKWSPMLAIRNAHTPTLVIHGQRDYRLDVSEGFQLFTALQLLNVPSRMLYFPDEGHWVLKPKNSELWYETVNDWCDRWTGTNKYASVGPERNPALQETGNRKQGSPKTRTARVPGAGVQTSVTNSKVDR